MAISSVGSGFINTSAFFGQPREGDAANPAFASGKVVKAPVSVVASELGGGREIVNILNMHTAVSTMLDVGQKGVVLVIKLSRCRLPAETLPSAAKAVSNSLKQFERELRAMITQGTDPHPMIRLTHAASSDISEKLGGLLRANLKNIPHFKQPGALDEFVEPFSRYFVNFIDAASKIRIL
ncbi:MAG: hypothetical protein ACK5PW_10465 [Burkholderiales bacterium]